MKAIGDMKAGLTSSRPKMTILPRTGMIYGVRAIEYGAIRTAAGRTIIAPVRGCRARTATRATRHASAPAFSQSNI